MLLLIIVSAYIFGALPRVQKLTLVGRQILSTVCNINVTSANFTDSKEITLHLKPGANVSLDLAVPFQNIAALAIV